MKERKWLYDASFDNPTEYDTRFSKWLNTRQGCKVFHFGTGGHHLVGLTSGTRHFIHGVTSSPMEMMSYLRKVEDDPSIMEYYRVIYADIYKLWSDELPEYDVVSLPHLCEYSEGNNELDQTILSRLVTRLRIGGEVVLFIGSTAFHQAKVIVESHWLLKRAETVGTLQFYKKASV